MNKDFSTIPANACVMSVGEFAIGDNGENAKTAPLSMVARSGKPIEHWFWGRVVHDLSGMKLHKTRLAVDYCHDDKEVVGYINKFSSESGDLVTSGALVTFKDSDRATEIIHKKKAGVPYEASINFGGDGIKIEEVGDGMVSQVNGYAFQGPGVIVREWPLRGVAICPYGADMNTSVSNEFSAGKTFSAQVVPTNKPTTEETKMTDVSVEVVASEKADAENEKEAVGKCADCGAIQESVLPPCVVCGSTNVSASEVLKDKPAEVKAETPAVVEAVEAGTVEAVEITAKPDEHKQEKTDSTRNEFSQMRADFGDAIAAETFANGGNYQSALLLAYKQSKTEIATLKERITELSAKSNTTGTPVKVTEFKSPVKLFNTGK